jgi:hypothetical protein
MNKKISYRLLVVFMAIALLGACKKDYITGGTPDDVNAYKSMTIYDVLKSNPLYDTVVRLIDTAGIKDKINAQGVTFFAPTDNAVLSYLNARTLRVQATINQNSKFLLDSLFYYLRNNIKGTRDSMLMYLVPKSLPYSSLTVSGNIYQTSLPGDSVIVSYEYVSTSNNNNGYNPIVSVVPQVVYFTQLWGAYTITPSTPAGSIKPPTGIHNLVKTSGITTQNGIMNALDNSNLLFFYGTNK